MAAAVQAEQAGDYAFAVGILPALEANIGGDADLSAEAATLTARWNGILLAEFGMWLAVGLGGALVGVALTWVRLPRRGAAKRTRLLNPFVTGRPLRNFDLVFGRDQLLRQIVEGVTVGQGFYLSGERRIGKTTTVLQVGDLLRERGFAVAFVDVAGTRGEAAKEVLHQALRVAARNAGLDGVGEPLALARSIAAKGRFVLLFDEVDALNHASSEIRQTVCDLCFGSFAPGRMVAAGVGLLLEGDPISDIFGASLVHIEVQPLPDDACRALLVEPLAGNVAWSEAALNAVVAAGEGRPLRIQLFGLKAVDQLGSAGGSRVELHHIDAVREAVDRAWKVIQEQQMDEEEIPLDIDAAIYELGRLNQEIEELERKLEFG